MKRVILAFIGLLLLSSWFLYRHLDPTGSHDAVSLAQHTTPFREDPEIDRYRPPELELEDEDRRNSRSLRSVDPHEPSEPDQATSAPQVELHDVAREKSHEVTKLAHLRCRLIHENPEILVQLVAQLQPGPGLGPIFPIDRDGQMDAEVPPGTYDLEIAPRDGAWAALYRRPGLQLVRGETLDLGTIALTNEPVLLRLHLLTVDAEPIEKGRLQLALRESGESEPFSEIDTRLTASPINLLVPRLPLEIEIALDGFRTRRQRITRRETHVQLASSLQARVVFRTMAALPPDVTLDVGLRPVGGVRRRPTIPVAFSTDEVSGLAELPAPGTYEVDCQLIMKPVRGRRIENVLVFEEPRRIEIHDSSATQVFHIDLGASNWDESLEELAHARESRDQRKTPRGRNRFLK